MPQPFKVHQNTVVVMELGGGEVVCAIATTQALAEDICDALNAKYLERLIDQG